MFDRSRTKNDGIWSVIAQDMLPSLKWLIQLCALLLLLFAHELPTQAAVGALSLEAASHVVCRRKGKREKGGGRREGAAGALL